MSNKQLTKGSTSIVDTPTTLPELPLTPLEPPKPVHYVVAQLDKNKVVIGMYSTDKKDYVDGDFKVSIGTSYSYNGLFDLLGRPNYKVAEVPVISSRPVLDEQGEQVYEEKMLEYPVFEEVHVMCPNGHPMFDDAGKPITELKQVYETITDEFGNEHEVPKMELRPTQVPVFEDYQSGTKEEMVLRTKEEKQKDRLEVDTQVQTLKQNDAVILLGEAQQNSQLSNQKSTNASLLLEIAQLRARITQLEGGTK